MLHSSIAWPRASASGAKIPDRASSPWMTASTSMPLILVVLEEGRLRVDAAGRRDARLVEDPPQLLRAPRRVVVAVVVEHGIDLDALLDESPDRVDPFLQLLGRVHPVEALAGVLRAADV